MALRVTPIWMVTVSAAAENAGVVVIRNKLESEIIELDDEEKVDFLAEMGMKNRSIASFAPATSYSTCRPTSPQDQ